MSALETSPVFVTFGVLLAGLIAAIAFFDVRQLIIPDTLNIALAGGGFAFQYWKGAEFPLVAIAFAAAVILAFLALRIAFEKLRGRTGLGMGDVKMAGASALWFSPWNFAFFLLIASASAIAFILFRNWRGGRMDFAAKVPFGPFLGLGVFVTWLCESTGAASLVPPGGF